MRFSGFCVAAFALTSALVDAQVQLIRFNETQAGSTIPATCITALSRSVACNSLLIPVKKYGVPGLKHFYTPTALTTLCTTGCATALSGWVRQVNSVCANVRVPTDHGTNILVAAWAEEFLEAYSSTCLGDGKGNLCNTVLGSLAGIDPAAQTSTATPGSSMPCHSCFLSLLQTQLAMPLIATDTGLKNFFTSVTSACSSTGWTIATPAATSWEIPATTTSGTPEPTCTGTTITLSGQTCQQVSVSNRISTRSLLAENNLSGKCYQFPTTGSLCIPDAAICEPYTVKSGDSCSSIASGASKTVTQIVTWNPELDLDCSNLDEEVGNVICVSNPGGDYVNPDPPPTTTTATFQSIPPMVMTSIEALPVPTNIGWNDTIEYATYANGTRLDCGLYIEAPILTDWTTETYSYECEDVAQQYNVNVTDLKEWNPSLLNNCTLSSDMKYCVQLADDDAPEPTEYCAEFAISNPGWDCGKYAAVHGVEVDQLVLWNPSLGSTCENYKTGVSYCVKVLHYKQPGIVSTCNKFVPANETDWANEPCSIIENKFGVGHARFVAWNPAVKTDCTGIYLGYDYCVSIPNYVPTFTSTAATAAAT